MRRKSLLILVVLATSLIFGLGFWFRQPPEPTYKGKKLSQWLEYIDDGPFATPTTPRVVMEQNWEQAHAALAEIGEAAVPYLLHLLEKRDSKFKLWLVNLARKQTAIPVSFRGQSEREYIAMGGFTAIGRKGKSAVPRLIKIVDDPKRDGGSAAMALMLIGPDAKEAIPALMRALNRKDRSCRIWAAGGLASVGKDNQTALLALIQALDDRDPIVRYSVLRAILEIGGDAKLRVPALIRCIDDPAQDVRREAAGWMESFGTNALVAVPRMKQLLADNDPAMRALAERFFQIVKVPASETDDHLSGQQK